MLTRVHHTSRMSQSNQRTCRSKPANAWRRRGARWGLVGLVGVAGCGAAAIAIGAAIVLGAWSGRLQVQFPEGSEAGRTSDGTGDARVIYGADDAGQPRLDTFSGVLPGFSTLGTTQATVDLPTGTVSGRVIRPSGEELDLNAAVPGIVAHRLPDNDGIQLSTANADGTETYDYGIQVGGRIGESNDDLEGDVAVTRMAKRGDTVLLNETGTGSITAHRLPASQSQLTTLPPMTAPPPPVQADAGADVTIPAGGSTTLAGSASGGQGTLQYAWTPTTGLSDPSALQPTASPTATTTYKLTVTDVASQQAVDAVTVTVGASAAGTGTVSGQVVNAVDGLPIGGATVLVAGLTATTDASGQFSVPGLPAGTQTVLVDMSGFAQSSTTLTVTDGATTTTQIGLVPDSDNVTVVLAWGELPGDLDLHVSGPDGVGGRFHAYFGARAPVAHVQLDLDDQSGAGPETTTIKTGTDGNFVAGDYHVWAVNFTQAPGFDQSNARVTITAAGAQVGQYDVSNATGDPATGTSSKRVWQVVNFTVETDGTVSSVTPVQMFVDESAGPVF